MWYPCLPLVSHNKVSLLFCISSPVSTLWVSVAHLRAGCLCQGLGHSLQLMKRGLQVLLLILDLRPPRPARFLGQWEQQLKDGAHFLRYLSKNRRGGMSICVHFQKSYKVNEVLSYSHNTIGRPIAWRLLVYIWPALKELMFQMLKVAHHWQKNGKKRYFLSHFPFSVPHVLFTHILSDSIYTLGGASITSSLYITSLSQIYRMMILISKQRYLGRDNRVIFYDNFTDTGQV